MPVRGEEALCTVGGNANWSGHQGEQYRDSWNPCHAGRSRLGREATGKPRGGALVTVPAGPSLLPGAGGGWGAGGKCVLQFQPPQGPVMGTDRKRLEPSRPRPQVPTEPQTPLGTAVQMGLSTQPVGMIQSLVHAAERGWLPTQQSSKRSDLVLSLEGKQPRGRGWHRTGPVDVTAGRGWW